MERTLVLVKPDGVQRGLIGEILGRLERKGLRIAGLKLMKLSQEQAHRHYGIHKGKGFYEELIRFITSAPLVAAVVEGPDAIKLTRVVVGATKPVDATPGSIRGDYAQTTGMNLVHASDAVETAQEEVANFFSPAELIDYQLSIARWLA